MPRYSLRTLLILLAIGPPLMAIVLLQAKSEVERYRERQRIKAWADYCVRTGWMISGDLPCGMPPTDLKVTEYDPLHNP